MQGYVANALILGCVLQRHRDIDRLTTDQDAIPVDPTPDDVIYVVVNDKEIDCMDQLPVADIWEEIRLHDGNGHRKLLFIISMILFWSSFAKSG
ncbi:MAG: hypothetical protein NUV74_18115 [Candidatus Brocadiaceae bacterium]|nr:hypothetical protein [Candidatus Brocadiaceae bacterium]